MSYTIGENGAIKYPSYEDWTADGVRLFGGNMMQWRFVCPACGHVASVEDWARAGLPEVDGPA